MLSERAVGKQLDTHYVFQCVGTTVMEDANSKHRSKSGTSTRCGPNLGLQDLQLERGRRRNGGRVSVCSGRIEERGSGVQRHHAIMRLKSGGRATWTLTSEEV